MARLPFVQVDTDFLTHGAAALAAILGPDVPPAVAGWAVLQLRTWALSRAEDEDSLGFIPGAHASRLVAAFAGWRGDPDAFLAALADPAVKLAEVTPEGVRLLGLGRDAAALRKGRGDRERMARRRSGDISGKTQTQTQTQTQKEETASAAGKPSPAQPELLPAEAEKPPEKPKPPRPRKPAEGPNALLWRALEAEYERRLGAKYVSGNGGADASTVSWLLANSIDTEAVRRWGNLLEWSKGGFPNVAGFVALRSHWNAPQVVGRVIPKVAGFAPPSRADSFMESLPPVASWQSDTREEGEDDGRIPI